MKEVVTADMAMSTGIEAIFSNVKAFIKGDKDYLPHDRWLEIAKFYDTQLFTIAMLLRHGTIGAKICKKLHAELALCVNHRMNEKFNCAYADIDMEWL